MRLYNSYTFYEDLMKKAYGAEEYDKLNKDIWNKKSKLQALHRATSAFSKGLSIDEVRSLAEVEPIKNDKLFIYGEATTKANIDYDGIAREVLKEVGYTNKFTIVKEMYLTGVDIMTTDQPENVEAWLNVL